MLKMFTVFDRKASTHSAPFFVRNASIAIRDFEFVVNDDPNSQIARFPEDFELFELGEFDEETAAVSVMQNPTFIVRGSSLKRKVGEQDAS